MLRRDFFIGHWFMLRFGFAQLLECRKGLQLCFLISCGAICLAIRYQATSSFGFIFVARSKRRPLARRLAIQIHAAETHKRFFKIRKTLQDRLIQLGGFRRSRIVWSYASS